MPYIIGSALLLVVVFIWYQSSIDFFSSIKESEGLKSVIQPFFDFVFGPGSLTSDFIRKSAHIIEFTICGALFSIFIWIILKRSNVVKMIYLKLFVLSSASSLLVAILDETIQYFSNRHARVSDVALDFCGSLFGIFVVILIVSIVEYVKKNGKK